MMEATVITVLKHEVLVKTITSLLETVTTFTQSKIPEIKEEIEKLDIEATATVLQALIKDIEQKKDGLWEKSESVNLCITNLEKVLSNIHQTLEELKQAEASQTQKWLWYWRASDHQQPLSKLSKFPLPFFSFFLKS